MLADLFEQEEEWESMAAGGHQTSTSQRLRKPAAKRSSVGFVGLENQGATCYLNSLIQAMYMTPELRSGMFAIDPKALGIDAMLEIEAEEREKVKLAEEQRLRQQETELRGAIDAAADVPVEEEVEPSESLLEMLLAMGVQENHAKRALIGTKNAALDEVFEYIEAHESDPEFNKPFPPSTTAGEDDGHTAAAAAGGDISAKRKRKKPRYIPIELQKLFARLKLIDQHTVSTHELTTKGFEWQNFDGQVQHDAHELNRLLLDALEKSLKRTSGETLCRSLYEGMGVNQIKCLGCLGTSERTEPFYDINLQIIDCADMAVSLRQYCAAELLSGDSAYQCDTCGCKRQALRSSVLRSLPPILTFSCSRFKIDRTTNWQRVKVTSRSEFPLYIDANPFLEGQPRINEEVHPDPELEREFVHETLRGSMIWLKDAVKAARTVARELLCQYRDQQQEAKAKREEQEVQDVQGIGLTQSVASIAPQGEGCHADVDGSSSKQHNFPSWSEILPDLEPEQYTAVAKHVAPHCFPDTTRSTATSATTTTTTTSRSMYQLHAVIMHRGSAYSGHYFAYIRDNLSEGQWEIPDRISSNYNNSTATTTTTNTANNNDSGSSSHPASSTATPALHPQYVVDAHTGSISIDNTSALAVVYRAVLAVLLKQRQQQSNNNNGGSKGQKTLSHTKNYTKQSLSSRTAKRGAKISLIGAEIGKQMRDSWANMHKPQFGPLENFIKTQEDIFQVSDRSEVLLAKQADLIHLIDSAAFHQLARIRNANNSHSGNGHGCGDGSSINNNSGAANEDGGWSTAGANKHKQRSTGTSSGRSNSSTPVGSPKGTKTGDRHTARASNGNTGKATVASVFPAMDGLPHLPNGSSASIAGDRQQQQQQQQQSSSMQRSRSDGESKQRKVEGKEEEEVREEGEEMALEALARDILSHFYGNYFEFNDSAVTPIALDHLERAFEGLDSAYLLVYRLVELPPLVTLENKSSPPATAAVSCAANSGNTSSSDLTTASSVAIVAATLPSVSSPPAVAQASAPPVPTVVAAVPDYWVRELETYNAQLAADRLAYDQAFSRITIHVYCPAHVVMDYPTPLLLPLASISNGTASTVASVVASAKRMQTAGRPNSTAVATATTTELSREGVPAQGNSKDTTVAAGGQILQFEVDSRVTVRKFMDEFLSTYSDQLVDMGLWSAQEAGEGARSENSTAAAAVAAIPAAGALDLGVTVLQRFGEGFYPIETLDQTSTLDECSHISDNCHVLLWNGHSLSFHSSNLAINNNSKDSDKVSNVEDEHEDASVLVGDAGYPVSVALSLLHVVDPIGNPIATPNSSDLKEVVRVSSSTSGKKDAKQLPPVSETKLFSSLYMSGTLSLLEFSHRLCALCNIDPLQACISILCQEPTSDDGAPPPHSSRDMPHSTLSQANDTRGHENHLVSTILYNRGIVLGKPLRGTAVYSMNSLASSSRKSGRVPSDGISSNLTSGCTLAEHAAPGAGGSSDSGIAGGQLHYVLIESLESRGLDQRISLAERFVLQKNAEWTLTVEVDFTPAAAAATTAIVASGSSSSGGGGGDGTGDEETFSALQFEIERECTVMDLKCAALRRLHLDLRTFRENTRLRLGANRGEKVLEDETISLVAAGLRNNIAVYLEIGTLIPTTSQKMRLQVVRVDGNSLAYTYAASQQGERLQQIEVEVLPTDTVLQVKDRIGTFLLQYSPGWAVIDHDDGKNTNISCDNTTCDNNDSSSSCSSSNNAVAVGANDVGNLLKVLGRGSGIRTHTGHAVLWPTTDTTGVNAAAATTTTTTTTTTSSADACVVAGGGVDDNSVTIDADAVAVQMVEVESPSPRCALSKREPQKDEQQEAQPLQPKAQQLAAALTTMPPEGFPGRRLRFTSWTGEFATLADELVEDTTLTTASIDTHSSSGRRGAKNSNSGTSSGDKDGHSGSNCKKVPNADTDADTAVDTFARLGLRPKTLQEAGIRDNDTILFEEGQLPMKGLMKIQLYVWMPTTRSSESEATVTMSASSAAQVLEGAAGGGVESAEPAEPAGLAGGDGGLDLSALAASTCMRRSCLLPLGSVELFERDNLLELQTRVQALINAQWSYLSAHNAIYPQQKQQQDLPPSTAAQSTTSTTATIPVESERIEYTAGEGASAAAIAMTTPLHAFLLRELRADLLPGRSFWMYERHVPATAAITSTATTSTGAGRSSVTSTASTAGAFGASGASGGNKYAKGHKKLNKSAPNAHATTPDSSVPTKAVNPSAPTAAVESLTPPPPEFAASAFSSMKRLNVRGERGLVVELCLHQRNANHTAMDQSHSTSTASTASAVADANYTTTDAASGVQGIFASQAVLRPPAGAFRVWAQQLQNPGAAEGHATMHPIWPPASVLINGGTAPTLGHLKRAMASVFPNIPPEHMCVYKYQPQTIEWLAMISSTGVPGSSTVGSFGGKKRTAGGAGGSGGHSKKSGESNITAAPYFVKEGDQFCAFDGRSVPQKVLANCVGTNGEISIALPEDIQLRSLKEHQKAERRRKKSRGILYDDSFPGGATHSAGARSGTYSDVNGNDRRSEIMLSLGRGFNFSDEDD